MISEEIVPDGAILPAKSTISPDSFTGFSVLSPFTV